MAGNKHLSSAKKAKNDEFYTQLSDIENELRHYRKHFKDKIVFCNCDDPFESNFFKYFVLNFNKLGLKKLIATCYVNSPIAGSQLSLFDVDPTAEPGTPYKAVVTTVYDAPGEREFELDEILGEEVVEPEKEKIIVEQEDDEDEDDEDIWGQEMKVGYAKYND